ncbi:ACP S-malonyltransferase [Amedibacillus sp. YH-ame10]
MKTAFLFSGQGAQYPGMGKELYENYASAKAVFDSINVDFDLKNLCFEGEGDVLNDTQYTQACIFAVSMAAAQVLKEQGIEADVAAGLSLGEYGALSYGGVFSIEEGAQILRERGKLMANALPAGTSAMSAVLMLDKDSILQACASVKEIGICEIANYNCPGQIVITGEKAAVEACGKKCEELGARRVIPLQVSGAFHCSLLNEAGKQLHDVLSKYELKKASIPVYNNISGKVENGPLIDVLAKQICSSVMLEDTIMNMLADGVDTFIEVGPGKAVSGFVKKCAKGVDVKILHVEDIASLNECVDALKG